MGSIFAGGRVPASGTARSADPGVRRPLRDLAGWILASARWCLPAFRHIATGEQMFEIQVEAQRNVERRRRQREAVDGTAGASMRAAAFLGGGAPRSLARSCAGMPGSGLGFTPQARIDDEVLHEVNVLCFQRGLVPELKL